MAPITFDPIAASALWLTFTAIRSRIPATWINLDGRRCWAGVFAVALVMAFVMQGDSGFTIVLPEGGYLAWLHTILQALVLSVGAVIIDGGAAAAGLKDDVRNVLTAGVKANRVATEAVETAEAVRDVAPTPLRPAIDGAVAEVKNVIAQYETVRAALLPLLDEQPPQRPA